jgi:hypothetical protein
MCGYLGADMGLRAGCDYHMHSGFMVGPCMAGTVGIWARPATCRMDRPLSGLACPAQQVCVGAASRQAGSPALSTANGTRVTICQPSSVGLGAARPLYGGGGVLGGEGLLWVGRVAGMGALGCLIGSRRYWLSMEEAPVW